ncbi:MAG: hypothetical protein Q9181_003179 [Wetmoreana brouardii]
MMPQTLILPPPLFMPPIAVDQLFPSLLAFKAALREWAIECNFTPHILDSDSHRVRAGCRSSPDCPFRIRCNWNDKRRHARVTTCEDAHTCISTSASVAHQNIKRAETGRLKFLVEAVPQLLDVTVMTTTTAIIEAVERRYGQRIPLRQAQKVKRALAGGIHGPCRYCRDGGHNKRNCPLRKQREEAGIIAPPTAAELGPEPYNYPDDDMSPNDTDGHQLPPGEPRCAICYQPGHGRDGCPREAMTTQHANDPPGYRNGGPSQPPAYSIPYDPPINHDDIYGTSTLQTPSHPPQPDRRLLSPSVPTDPALSNDPPRTAKEIQAEAARLMQQAAKLMNEAARMNAEAARLTASINVA